MLPFLVAMLIYAASKTSIVKLEPHNLTPAAGNPHCSCRAQVSPVTATAWNWSFYISTAEDRLSQYILYMVLLPQDINTGWPK